MRVPNHQCWLNPAALEAPVGDAPDSHTQLARGTGHVNKTLQNIQNAVLSAPAVRGIRIIGI
jgi:hypothetical protein